MVNIQHNLVIGAPMDRVYEAISTLKGLSNWWTIDASGNSGKEGEIRFGFDGGMFNRMKVMAAEANAHIAWHCIDGPEEWIGTDLSFTISEDVNRNSMLKFEHRGWKEATDFYGSCNYHWGLFMKSLKSLCETGKGMPHGGSF